MTNSVKKSVFGLLIALILVIITTVSASAAINSQINFQGKITNPDGTNLTNGSYSIVFSLYNVGSAGTALWSETDSVTVTDGVFQVNLGASCPLLTSNACNNNTPIDFNNSSLFLGIKVGTDPEMTPRVTFTASPYAFNSDKVGGLTVSQLVQLSPGSQQNGSINISGSITTASSLAVQGANAITLGSTANVGALLFQDGTANNRLVTVNSPALTASYTLTLPTTAPSLSQCLQSGASTASQLIFAACSVTPTLQQVYTASGAANPQILLSSTGGGFKIQDAATSVGGNLFAVSNNGAATTYLAVATTGTTTTNLTVAAAGSVNLVGGITSTRPASPSAGQLYYDQTTNQLIQYNGSKWVGAPRSTTKIVAASNASQAEKDAADFVATGTGDQATINSALTAAAGGSVYLTEGTFLESAAISIPNNTKLSGSGAGTIITIPNAQNLGYYIIQNTDQTTGTNVTVRDLQIDGNKANQTSGNLSGIAFNNMGGGSGTTARVGATLINLLIKNLLNSDSINLANSSTNTLTGNIMLSDNNGIYVTSSTNNIFTANTILDANGTGFYLATSNNNTVSDNIVSRSNTTGLFIAGSNGNTITGNNIQGNGTDGVYVTNSSNNTLTSNISQGNNTGFSIYNSNNNIISANKIHDNGGNSNNNGITLQSSSAGNTITDNDITDTSCTTTCYAINISAASTTNYLSSNRHNGTGTNPSTINDASPNTTYANQTDSNGNLINRNQGALTVGTITASKTLTLQGSLSATQLPTPAAPSLATAGTAGTTSYTYAISALDGSGETLPSTGTAITTGNATLSSTNYNTISWAQVGGAVQYKVFRTASAGTPATTGLIATVSANIFTYSDTGVAASGAVAASNTTGNAAIAGLIQGGTLNINGSASIGATGTSTLSSNTTIGNSSNATGIQTITIGSNANAANAVSIDAGNTGLLQIGDTSTAHTIHIGTAGTAGGALQNITIGSNSTSTASLLTLQSGNITAVNNQAGVIIGNGFSTTSTNLVPLTLDSSSTLIETANTCTATANNGAMYFNSNPGSMVVRTCISGSWEDMISTAGAFFAFFGVVPDSGAVPGDIQALSTANTTGPCKVSYASPTTVTVTACTAYSGDRKVTVAANTLTITPANNNFFHICLSGTNNQPVVSAGSTTEFANLSTVSFPSASGPILCLADVKTSGAAITGVYDTRMFTTTTKEFAYSAAAVPLGVMLKPDGTNINRLNLPGTAATGFIRGVVVASSGTAYVSGGPNVIIATAGDVAVKASAGVMSLTQTVQNSTTVSGYAQIGNTSANAYGNLGIAQNSFSNTCTTSANCNTSLLIDLRLR